ncbi:MAG: regulatory protein RecX [Bacillota bacterium]
MIDAENPGFVFKPRISGMGDGMLFDEKYEKARKAAYKYLSYRPRTEYEITERLLRKGFDEQTISQVVDKLREYRLLDDDSYVENYLAKRAMRSRAALEEELKNLGVRDSIADRALESIDSGAELRIAMALAISRRKRRGNDYPIVNIASFLRRRGFSQEVVERVCDYLENMRHP